MKKCLLLWLLAAAPSWAQSDAAAIEAYRRLPFCRLAPDGLRLVQEPCRRPPTRSSGTRRGAVPQPAAPSMPTGTQAGTLLSPAAGESTRPPTPAQPSASRAAPPPAAILPPQPGTQPLNQCGIAGCRGANGALYQQGAGNILLDPAGRMCTRHGDWVHCQ